MFSIATDVTNDIDVDAETENIEEMPFVESTPEITTFCGCDSVEEFTKIGLQRIVDATKCAHSLPSGASRDLYTAYPSFTRTMNTQSTNILQIISNVVKYQNVKGNMIRRDNDEKFELLQECNDVILERINSNLDVMAGIKKTPEILLVESQVSTPRSKPASGSWNDRSPAASAAKTLRILSSKSIPKPQIIFKTRVDNSNMTAFEPKIKDKPNSLKPLAVLPEYDEDGNIESYLHPYEFELNKFEVNPKDLQPVEPLNAMKIDDTPLDFINNKVNLKRLTDELSHELELAVDVEHHSYRTFQGITCLLQISTRTKDYIIDTIALRDELHVLNSVFTNPKIVKIFHGADLDIQWLQRDLALYIVNMFDTHQAAKRLGLARLSLAYLLKNYCQIELDKTFQLADWRIRPLPQELIEYARKDTHYLLFIFDMMRNELLKMSNGQPNILINVYQSSTEICKLRYIKPRIKTDSYMDVYRKSKKNFDNRQLYAFKEIFLWRDKMARDEDESYGYVLPNHMMLQIAEALPREIQGILACCNPIPTLVRQHLVPLHQIILKAREQPLVKPITEIASIAPRTTTSVRDINSQLHCPHDLSHSSEFRDDLPTLLTDTIVNNVKTNLLLTKPTLSVFDTPENSEDEVNEKYEKIKKIKFLSPYKRFKLILPFAEQQRLEELEKENKARQSRVLCPERIPETEVPKQQNVETPDMPLKNLKNKRKHNEEDDSVSKIKKTKKNKSDSKSDEIDKNDTCFSKPSDIKVKSKNKIESDDENDSDADAVVEINTLPPPIEIKSESENEEKTKVIQPKKKRLDKKARLLRNKQYSKCQTKQHSSQQVPFDYSKVDFKRFQGGSHQNTSGEQTNSKFHAKGKNKKDLKKFNKMFSFSNINKKK